MRTDRIGWLVAVFVILSVVAPVAARAQTVSACDSGRPDVRRGGWLLDVSYRTQGRIQSANNLKQISIGFHNIARQGQQTLVFFLGGVPIQDGASSTLLLAESLQTVSCADTDGDGRIGIVLLQFLLRDVRTDELVPGFIIPIDGELDDDGTEEVMIVIGQTTVVGEVTPDSGCSAPSCRSSCAPAAVTLAQKRLKVGRPRDRDVPSSDNVRSRGTRSASHRGSHPPAGPGVLAGTARRAFPRSTASAPRPGATPPRPYRRGDRRAQHARAA